MPPSSLAHSHNPTYIYAHTTVTKRYEPETEQLVDPSDPSGKTFIKPFSLKDKNGKELKQFHPCHVDPVRCMNVSPHHRTTRYNWCASILRARALKTLGSPPDGRDWSYLKDLQGLTGAKLREAIEVRYDKDVEGAVVGKGFVKEVEVKIRNDNTGVTKKEKYRKYEGYWVRQGSRHMTELERVTGGGQKIACPIH